MYVISKDFNMSGTWNNVFKEFSTDVDVKQAVTYLQALDSDSFLRRHTSLGVTVVQMHKCQ
jgi:hypothetical protein